VSDLRTGRNQDTLRTSFNFKEPQILRDEFKQANLTTLIQKNKRTSDQQRKVMLKLKSKIQQQLSVSKQDTMADTS
jgi:hypothetical protein